MKENKFEKCIKELKKPFQNRDQSIIIDYIKTLEPFMNLIEQRNENSEDIIIKISKIMTLQSNRTNDLIIQYGDKGNNFYIILKGTIGILVPKYNEYYMNEEDFILHILKLKKYNQNELILQCLRQNNSNFSIANEKFEDILNELKNINSKESLSYDKRRISKEISELYKYINSEEYINSKKGILNISPEKYMSSIDVEENVKKNTEKLNYLNNLNIPFDKRDEDKKLTRIPNYEIVSKFNNGYSFGELALENINKKRQATIIALTDCDFGVINKLEYNELIKESYSKSKNKFLNLIYEYKIFDDIPYAIFDKKYYNHFQYLKMKKNSYLLHEGEKCDDVYFISNGEFELFIEKNIQEVNYLILGLKYMIDDLKKTIIKETNNKIINYNSKNKTKEALKLKSNMNLFFSKYESELKLEEVAYIIKNRDIINDKKYLGKKFNKIVSEKKRITLGIYKSRQILGLNDIINRSNGNNISFFNCKCSSFYGELYHIEYEKYNSIYENEENVKLYTNELLYQNLYCIIGRLLSHKNYIYDFAKKRESDIMSLLFLDKNKIYKEQNINNIINNSNKTINENQKNSINIMLANKVKFNPFIKKQNKIHFRNMNISRLNSLTNESYSNVKQRNHSSRFKKQVNINILNHLNYVKIENDSYYKTFSEKKFREIKKESNDNNNQNNNSSNYNKSILENYISKNSNTNILSKSNSNFNSKSHKIIKKKAKYKSKILMNENKTRTKSEETDIKILEDKNKNPVLIINDKEVEINENIRENHNYKKNYKNLIKSLYCKNRKLKDLINSKELKNIALFGDFSESIEIKNKNNYLFRKKKDLLISRNNIKNIHNKNIYMVNNYSDKKYIYYSNNNKNNKSTRFITYNLGDLNGKNKKEIKLKINETINLIKSRNYKKNKFIFNNGINRLYYKNDYNPKSLSFRNNKIKSRIFSPFANFNKKSILKKNLSNNFQISKIIKNNNNSEKNFPLIE